MSQPESELRQLHRELEERNRLVTVAGRVARLGGWMIDLERGIVHWSDETCAIHDAPAGVRVTLQEGLESFTPECRPLIVESVRACAEQGTPYDLELEKFTFTGRRIWVRTIGEPIRSADGRITHIHGAFQDITAQRLEHARQLESERRYRLLFEQSFDGILHTLPDGRILSANPSACRMLGYSEDELRQLGRAGIVDPADPRPSELFDQLEAAGRVIGEITLVRRDGTLLPVEVSSRIFDDEDGNANSSLFIRDISDRKIAETALRESEETLRQITENIREIFWMFDPDFTKTIYVSPAYEEIWGRPIPHLYDHPAVFVEAVHPEDRERVTAAMRTATTRVLDGIDYRLVHPDGQVRWVRSRGYPIHNALGEVYRVVGTTEDITDRMKAEDDRKVAEAEYHHLFDTAPYGIYSLDAEGRFTRLNPAAETLLQLPARELLGEHFATIIAPADLELAQQGFDSVISGEANHIEFDQRIRHPNGEERVLRVTESAIHEGDRIVGTHGIARDITEELEREKSLRRAQRLASVGTLLSGVAHELNNPLHAIVNFADLMLLDERLPEDHEALQVIRREADRAAEIVADLRQVARGTREEGSRREPVDLNDVVRHVLKVRRYSLATGNVEVSTELPDHLPLVQANRGQIEQVVLNLVVNAEQAMAGHDGPRQLTLRTGHRAGGIALTVTDSGPGIARKALEHIFDPFFTTKDPGDGTGLGLSLAHTIMLEHGGRIHVESEIGQGATFRIELPLAPGAEPAIEHQVRLAGSIPPQSILIVDDEPAIRRGMSRFLNQQGHEVVEAADGAAALELLKEQQFDLILSDLKMPGLGGLELLEHLRSSGLGMERRLIFITGDVTSAREGLWTDGVEIPVLVKPVPLERIVRTIESIVAPPAP